jgi:CBS domain-containing protein
MRKFLFLGLASAMVLNFGTIAPNLFSAPGLIPEVAMTTTSPVAVNLPDETLPAAPAIPVRAANEDRDSLYLTEQKLAAVVDNLVGLFTGADIFSALMSSVTTPALSPVPIMATHAIMQAAPYEAVRR